MENMVKGRFRSSLVLTLAGLHVAAIVGVFLYPPWQVSPSVLVAAVAFYVVRSLGITIMHHRCWTHGSFRCGYWTQMFWAFCAALAFEGPGMIPKERQADSHSRGWVADHRQHHAFTDDVWDPHTPKLFGFWWAHLGWLVYETRWPDTYNPVDPLQDDPVALWQYRSFLPIAVGVGFLLPTLIWGPAGLVWCGFAGVVAHLNSAWTVNSVCHLWGRRPRTISGGEYTADQSRNNRWVALVTMGEGNHGNHHVKQNSAQLGERWYDFDLGWLVIRFMGYTGLAWRITARS